MSTLTIETPRVFVPLLKPARYKGAYGGRGSGKSHFFAECVVEEMIADANCSVVCIREIQKSLKFSAKKLVEEKIASMGVSHLFEIQSTEIKRIGGKGVCIFQGMQDHTADSIKSLEGFKIAWVEEAQSLSQRSLNLLRPTIRAPGSQIWFSWNPRRKSDPVEKLLRRKKRDDAIIVRANYTDNPFLPAELRSEAEGDKRDDPDGFAHTWLGEYESMGSKVVIPRLWIDACVDLAAKLGIEPTGKTYSALDVAGAEDGGDENAQAIRQGIELFFLDKWNGYDTALTTRRAIANNVAHDARHGHYDSAGVGEGVTGEWGSMGRSGQRPEGFDMLPWNGGYAVLDPDGRSDPDNKRSPLNKNQYQNLKAQAWFAFRRRCHNAYKAINGQPYDAEMLVSFPPDLPHLEQLLDELGQPQQKTSGTGKTMVDKQPDDSASPNLADSVVMAYFPLPAAQRTYDLSTL
ncbi:PBSX family phage terminase large subunit [Erythrobacter sp. SCSIO 43205]|uniref:PBSX family phage terminase large subunit n=1 Tax=Erythrobacter sp. SCSIO 43205 TaxID=2779361 RepID=UPI001CA814DB|nr:PBSX family phage terminase large subunit [Erythrobacter sp. SCSIO 43205]UAB76973.1 PBSX family phage terminase large subunit [Erythrobacter sp. SCSIO 43205]